MANPPTTNYGLKRPTVGGDLNVWGELIVGLNENMDTIDAVMKQIEDDHTAAVDGLDTRVVAIASVNDDQLAKGTEISGKVTALNNLTAAAQIRINAINAKIADLNARCAEAELYDIRLRATRTFTVNDTWTKPFGLTSVDIDAWAGGGGGASSSNGADGGGGGGGYSRMYGVPAAALKSGPLTMSVGGGANFNADGGDALPTEVSIFADDSILRAEGGLGGKRTGTGGNGGAGDFENGSKGGTWRIDENLIITRTDAENRVWAGAGGGWVSTSTSGGNGISTNGGDGGISRAGAVDLDGKPRGGGGGAREDGAGGRGGRGEVVIREFGWSK